ncbi:hypothetical protein HHI36_012946 [Cryptolaemus montrouzieri]|uniref:Uncharacterized protein n=1 Tax=Cryptolaemus montrouzieri TaxID=559131 RepID=A0ABD2NGC7_9CUCU
MEEGSKRVERDEGMRSTNIRKKEFPPLLSKMLNIVQPNIAENLKAGFRKCGIFPLDMNEVLNASLYVPILKRKRLLPEKDLKLRELKGIVEKRWTFLLEKVNVYQIL